MNCRHGASTFQAISSDHDKKSVAESVHVESMGESVGCRYGKIVSMIQELALTRTGKTSVFSDIEEAYDGPHLPETGVTRDFVEAMIARFKQQKMIHRKYAFKVRQLWADEAW